MTLYSFMKGRPLGFAESQVLELYGQGKTAQEIADIRGRRLSTVNSQLDILQSKLGATTRGDLLAKSMSLQGANDGD